MKTNTEPIVAFYGLTNIIRLIEGKIANSAELEETV